MEIDQSVITADKVEMLLICGKTHLSRVLLEINLITETQITDQLTSQLYQSSCRNSNRHEMFMIVTYINTMQTFLFPVSEYMPLARLRKL
jgi:hypothetical protein